MRRIPSHPPFAPPSNPAHRDLTSSSLALLRAALPGVAASLPCLLDLDVWGALVGMFNPSTQRTYSEQQSCPNDNQ